MNAALFRSSLLVVLTAACSHGPPPEPPRVCTAGGAQDPIVYLDGGVKAPPGWTTVEVDFDHQVACFELVHDNIAWEKHNDAGVLVASHWAEDLPAVAIDHPKVGSKLTVALRGNMWSCGVWWDGSAGSVFGSFLPDELGGSMKLVAPSPRLAHTTDWPLPALSALEEGGTQPETQRGDGGSVR